MCLIPQIFHYPHIYICVYVCVHICNVWLNVNMCLCIYTYICVYMLNMYDYVCVYICKHSEIWKVMPIWIKYGPKYLVLKNAQPAAEESACMGKVMWGLSMLGWRLTWVQEKQLMSFENKVGVIGTICFCFRFSVQIHLTSIKTVTDAWLISWNVSLRALQPLVVFWEGRHSVAFLWCLRC